MDPDAIFGTFDLYARGVVNQLTAWMRLMPVSFAFSAGMVATLNPCGFIMLPSFALFYFSTDDASTRNWLLRVRRAALMGLLVSLAFVVTFGIVGLAVTVVGRHLIGWSYWAGLAIGLALVAFAAYQLITRRSVFASATAGMRVTRSRTAQGVFMFGVAYAVVSLGCTLPIFMLTMGSVFTGDADYLTSMRRFAEYGAGMGLVLMLVAVGVSIARQQVLSVVGAVLPYVSVVANVALLFAGSYVAWYWWRALT